MCIWGLTWVCLLGGTPPAEALGNANNSSSSSTAQARCCIEDPRGHTVHLQRVGAPWDGWPELCATFVNYLKLPPVAVDANMLRQVERNLMPPGYFEKIACSALGPMELACVLTPARMVKSYSLHGHVPFTLLQQDLHRRIFLRPGTVVRDAEQEIKKQQERLRAYLVGEGYFDAQVTIVPTVVQGVEPNEGLHLAITSEPGGTSVVGDVAVQGDQVVPEADLAQFFRHKWIVGVPTRFRPAQFNDDLFAASRHLQTAGWPAAHVQGTYTYNPKRRKVDVRLQVAAGSRVDVRFCGNTAFSDKSLRALAPFEAAGAIDAVAIEEMRAQIVRRYQAKGYVDVDVQSVSERLDAKTLQVTFTIKPGRQMPVGQVHMTGLSPEEIEALHKQVDLLCRPSSWWHNRYWVDHYVARDVRALRNALHHQGYTTAEVRAEKQMGPDAQTLDILFVLEAGPRRFIDTVHFDGGGTIVDPNQFLSRLSQRPQRPYVAEAVHDDGQEIQAWLASQGYTAAQVEDRVEVPQAQKSVTSGVQVYHTLRLGPKACVGGLFLRGNLRTSRAVLEQELHSRPGDALDLAALGLARRRLRSFNIFNTVQLSPLTPQPDDPTTWLLLTLEERDVRILDGVASYSSDYQFSVGADYRDRNLFGRTMLLTVQLRLSNASEVLLPKLRIGNQDLLNITLKAPHPFGLPFDAEGSLLYRYQDVLEYRERRMGGLGSISRPVLSRSRCAYCPSILGKLGYELTEAYRIDNIDVTSTELAHVPNKTIARVIPSFNVSRRDSPIDPTQGYNYDLRLELGHPVLAGLLHKNATAFWRVLTGVQGYVPLGVPFTHRLDETRSLGGPVVLAAALQYSAAGPWTAHGAVPPSETFGYGGDFSVRGLVNRASTQQIDNAHYMLTGSVELRWYAIPNLGFGTVQVGAFVDMGSVASNLKTLTQQTTLSIGPVLRYVTPIGPLSLAYGRALVLPAALRAAPDAAPPQGRVHLTFGYSF